MNYRMLPIAGLAIAAALPLAATADTLGFRVSADSWRQQFDGYVQDGPDRIDINDTLGIDDETNNMFSVSFEHPVPFLPNISLTRTKLDVSASNTINQSFTFDNVTYTVTDQVKTNADLSHTDATLYYEVLDNWVSLDLGLTIRKFDEGVQLRSSAGTAKLDLDVVIPMLYVATKFDLPLTGLYIGADVNGISFRGSSLIDYKINIGYESSIGLGIEAGMRRFDINYEDNNDSSQQADVTIDGAYAGLFYHF